MASYKVKRKVSADSDDKSVNKGIQGLGKKLSEPLSYWRAYRRTDKQDALMEQYRVNRKTPMPSSYDGAYTPRIYSRSRALPGSIERNRQINYNNERVAGHNAVLLIFLVSFFQIITTIQLMLRMDEKYKSDTLWIFIFLLITEWGYYAVTLLLFRRKTYELEALAFFLSGIGMTVLAATQPDELRTQFIAMLIGVALYTMLVWFMKDVERMLLARYVVGTLVILLFIVNLVLGRGPSGVRHWIYVGPISIQPSEILKIGFILAGVSTLERHQTAKNLGMFILFSLFCIGALVLMKDFGMALIYFATFLIIAFIRSGDVRNIALVTAGAVGGAIITISFRPYIADRFKAYGKVWEYAETLGYQQTQTLTAAASGGLFGVGIGNGKLKSIFASNNDLVFGILVEEWGLIFAILVVIAFCALVFYAMTCATTARSTFYAITACAASGLLLFQTCLNIFGSTDILPLTGVTLPFISKGGSSLIAAWGLISFIKAVDGRTYTKRGAII